MPFDVVLVEPEIPQNTGNIARTCAATNTGLHLVRPLGFDIGDKAVRRAGLDYWKYVDLHIYDSMDDFLKTACGRKLILATTKASMVYTDMDYCSDDMILFGRETKGLPSDFIREHEDTAVRIPMSEDTSLRSLNLANSVNIILFEALRQNGFEELF